MDVPPELFSVLQEVRKAMVSFRSHEQRKEAAELVELGRIFQVFDGLIQRSSSLVSGRPFPEEGGEGDDEIVEAESVGSTDDDDDDVDEGDGDLKSIYPIITPSSRIVALTSAAFPGDGESEKLNQMNVATVIENSFKSQDWCHCLESSRQTDGQG